MIAIKIHRSYRTVVGICDASLIGKKFEENERQLDLRENFYKEKEVQIDEAVRIIGIQAVEDATFNIVGKNSIQAAIKAGIIREKEVDSIQGIPFALTFL